MENPQQQQQAPAEPLASRFLSPPNILTTPPTTQTNSINSSGPKASLHQDQKHVQLQEVLDPKVIDPTVFKDPNQRYAAILARAQRIQSNDKFKALSDGHKKNVMLNYYNKYVKPGYEQTGQAAPSSEVWLAGLQHTNRFQPSDYFENSFDSDMSHLGMSMWNGLESLPAGMLMAGSWISTKEALGALGLAAHFPNAAAKDYLTSQAARDKIAAQNMKHMSEKVSANFDSSVNFWMQTHPTKNLQEKVASGLGDMVGTLPLYQALGAAKLAETGVEATSLTSKLLTTKPGRFVVRRLAEASDGYLATILQGKPEDARINALKFAGFGTGFEGIGAVASRALTKTWSAKVITAGGVVLADTITHEAATQLEDGIVGHGAEGAIKVTDNSIEQAGKNLPLEPEQREAAILHALTHVEEHDPVIAKMNMAEKAALNSEAHLQFKRDFHTLSAEQKTAVINARMQTSRDAAHELPIHDPEIAKAQAEQSIERDHLGNPWLKQRQAQIEQKYGVKISDELQESEASKIKAETGIKSPQRATQKVANATTKSVAASIPKVIADIKPRYGYGSANFKLKFDSATDKALYTIAANKVSKAEPAILDHLRATFPGKSDSELKAMGRAIKDSIKEQAKKATAETGDTLIVPHSHDVEKTRLEVGEPEIKKLGSKAAQEHEPRTYVQFKTETLAYFKNKAAASKSDKALGKYLKDIDPKDLAEDLAESLGVEKVFENPTHLLLYANHFRDELPKPYATKIRQALREEGALGYKMTIKELDEMSDNLERHMDRLSYTGRLWDGERFFRSTKVKNWATKTIWQRDLHRENAAYELEQFSKMMEPYKSNYPQQVNTALKIMTRMQAERKKLQDAISDRQATERIRGFASEVANKLEGDR